MYKIQQLYNHCPSSPYPVAIRPRVKVGNDGAEQTNKQFATEKPFMELVIDIAPPHRTGIQSLSAGASVHDIEVFVDLAFILRIQRFLLCLQDHVMEATGNRALDFVDSQRVWGLPNVDRMSKQNTGKTSYHFRRLTILPCEIKLSVAPAPSLALHQEEFEGAEASAIHAAVRKGDLLLGEGTGVIGVKIGGKNRTAISVVQGMMKSILVDALLRCDGASLNFEGNVFHPTQGNNFISILTNSSINSNSQIQALHYLTIPRTVFSSGHILARTTLPPSLEMYQVSSVLLLRLGILLD